MISDWQDLTALETLLAQIRPMVVRYCRVRLARVAGQYQAADDVAQEVCLAVVSALPSTALWPGCGTLPSGSKAPDLRWCLRGRRAAGH